MALYWSCLFLGSLILVFAYDYMANTCSRRSYRPRDQCSMPVPRDYIIPMLEPGEAGTVTRRTLVPDRIHVLHTVAVDPPVFEIPDFLSSSECDAIIESAMENGLNPATLMGKNDTLAGGKHIGRVGETTFLLSSQFRHIRERIASLTRLPLDIVLESEGYQIGHYWPGGFYRDHYDSTWGLDEEEEILKPCCHQLGGLQVTNRCNLCRYVTVLMYLNDVEEGGETGFPAADLTGDGQRLTENLPGQPANCSLKKLVVKPQKGKAVLWYNHHRDNTDGWLGEINPRSMHGGCDVTSGEKWIANVWINVPPYSDRNKPSIYGDKRCKEF